jgi:tetratricopeptide (TPR) repeat protein
LIGIIWARTFGEKLAQPLTSLFDDGGAELKPAPLYSIAIARRKQGQPLEALAEIDRQLLRFPDDSEGTLLRAEIEALDLKDLSAAEQTLDTWLNSGSCDPGHEAVAHTKLADWHLQVTHDVQAAKNHLQAIIGSAPRSEAALFAEQRLAHLDFEAQPKNQAIRVTPDSGKAVDTGVPPPVTPEAPDADVPGLLQHLKDHPHDIAARENLIQIYAWETRQVDLARTQLETLIQLRHDSPRAVARCLNTLADVEIQLAGNEEAARGALHRIIDQHPSSPPAHQAENRLRFLSREMARHQHARIVAAHSRPTTSQ